MIVLAGPNGAGFQPQPAAKPLPDIRERAPGLRDVASARLDQIGL